MTHKGHWDNTRIALVGTILIVIVDLIGVLLVRLVVHEIPVVHGDVSKVGIGGLGGYLLARKGMGEGEEQCPNCNKVLAKVRSQIPDGPYKEKDTL